MYPQQYLQNMLNLGWQYADRVYIKSKCSTCNKEYDVLLQQKGEFTICRVYIKSKCLRAFDRRPAAPPMNTPALLSAQQVDHNQPSSSDQHQIQARSMVEIRRCRSSESSWSSGEEAAVNNNNNNDATQGLNNNQVNIIMDMECDQQQPLWEWDDSWMNHWNLSTHYWFSFKIYVVRSTTL